MSEPRDLLEYLAEQDAMPRQMRIDGGHDPYPLHQPNPVSKPDPVPPPKKKRRNPRVQAQ